ncbi:MAG: RHS repeat-associated core domain-containing protein, partial [Acidobacteriota bacterium]
LPVGASRCAFLTAKERDSESNLDYFGARYFSGAQGRFTSVDPENAGANEDDPQRWNGYSYARNNPLLYTDPTGKAIRICDNNNENCANSEFDPHYFERTNPNLRFGNGVINAVNEDGSLTRVGTYTEFGDYEDATGGLLLFAGLARAAFSGAVALVDSAATSLSRSYARMAGSEAGVFRIGGAGSSLSQGEQSSVKKLTNILNQGLKPGAKGDISGALADLTGSPVPKPSQLGGGFYNHTQDLNNMLRGLRKHVEMLKNVSDPGVQALRQRGIEAIRQIESAFKGAGI